MAWGVPIAPCRSPPNVWRIHRWRSWVVKASERPCAIVVNGAGRALRGIPRGVTWCVANWRGPSGSRRVVRNACSISTPPALPALATPCPSAMRRRCVSPLARPKTTGPPGSRRGGRGGCRKRAAYPWCAHVGRAMRPRPRWCRHVPRPDGRPWPLLPRRGLGSPLRPGTPRPLPPPWHRAACSRAFQAPSRGCGR